MMVDKMPDEIWIKIFGYISLEDRIRNVQFCCKRFHRLCADNTLTRNLDFSKAVFLPEEMCLNAVNKAKEHVSRLSFKGCHWLDSSLFTDLPHLPALETLNIVCCFLDADQIPSLLQKVPKLKNLALTLSKQQIEHLRYITGNSTQVWPEIHLQRLYLHMDSGNEVIEEEDVLDCSLCMYDLFFPDGKAEYYFVDIHDYYSHYDVLRISRTVADFHSCNLPDTNYWENDFCMFMKHLGLHKPLDYGVNALRHLDLPELKYMRMPYFHPDAVSGCTGALIPNSLPSLEYLECSMFFNETGSLECYRKLAPGILFDCELPSLKYFHFKSSRPPMEFYTSVSKMRKLLELHLTGCFDLNLLLESIQCLSRLESLEVVFERENDGRAFLEGLALAAPRLRKLKVTLHAKDTISYVFHPIQNLVFLESLEIYSRISSGFGDADAFSTVLKNLRQLSSVTFQVYGKSKKPYFFVSIIHNALKFLPNLVQFTIRNTQEPMQDLLEALKECKKLEKLWIDDLHLENPIESSTFLPLLEEVITSLPRLHIITLSTHEFCVSVKECVEQLREK